MTLRTVLQMLEVPMINDEIVTTIEAELTKEYDLTATAVIYALTILNTF